jgi:hypothetical protein
MGNVNLLFVAATPPIAEFTFRGQLTTEASTTRGNPVGLPTLAPPRWVGSGSVIVESLGAVIENLNFNTNNTLFEQRASWAASGSGVFRVLITERAPGGSMDPEASNTSSHNWIANWRSTSGSIIQVVAGVDAGNRVTLTMSQAIAKTSGRGDKEGLAIFNTDYQAYERNGNDEWRIAFD